MKKLLSIAICATAVAAFAADGDVTINVGTVGVTAVSSGMANTIVAVSYKDLADGISEISVSNLVKTTNLTVGDQLSVFNGSTYDTWSLVEGTGGNYWKRNAKTYTIGSDGKISSATGTDASILTKSVGTGIWLTRQSVNDPFYIYGAPVNSPSTETEPGKWNLIGNASQNSAKSVQGITGMSDGDQLAVVNGEGKIISYQWKSSKGWRRNVTNVWEYATESIPAGCGCWIKTKESKTIQW